MSLITPVHILRNRRVHAGGCRTHLLSLAASLLLLGFAFCTRASAVSPAPDGGYPGQNTAEGDDALFSLNSATATIIGNTAVGNSALYSNTSGNENTGVGMEALLSNTSGNDNTAVGTRALRQNTGALNVAVGAEAMEQNTSGQQNVAVGVNALVHNSTADSNTASGFSALESNTSGSANTASGAHALDSNKVGNNNTADGTAALFDNTNGNRNTAAGAEALAHNTGGDGNIALGFQAGLNLTTGNNNIDIGALGAAGESNTIRIGKADTHQAAFLQGVYGHSVSNGLRVTINSAGKLGVEQISSARFKEEIKPMEHASSSLLALRPVTFRYKHEVDQDDLPQFGLVAEEVEKVNPDLVLRDGEGKVNAVRYEAVNAMLLNEFLKEHSKVEAQGATIAELKKQVADLSAGLRKVSAQVATRDPATLASNDH